MQRCRILLAASSFFFHPTFSTRCSSSFFFIPPGVVIIYKFNLRGTDITTFILFLFFFSFLFYFFSQLLVGLRLSSSSLDYIIWSNSYPLATWCAFSKQKNKKTTQNTSHLFVLAFLIHLWSPHSRRRAKEYHHNIMERFDIPTHIQTFF